MTRLREQDKERIKKLIFFFLDEPGQFQYSLQKTSRYFIVLNDDGEEQRSGTELEIVELFRCQLVFE